MAGLHYAHKPPLHVRWVALAVGVSVIVGLGVWVFWELEVGPYLQNGFPPGAAGFAFGGPPMRAPPGSQGCRAITGNVCYSDSFVTLYHGESFSDLQLNVGTGANPRGAPVPLGPGAVILAFSPSDGLLAVWNVSGQAWIVGSNAGIPQNVQVPVVLDTGLTSNSTLANAMLWGSLEGQGSGVYLVYA
jgi:hypothetical protein